MMIIIIFSYLIYQCWSEPLGYKCCSKNNRKVTKIDKYGEWGTENGEYCGIVKQYVSIHTINSLFI